LAYDYSFKKFSHQARINYPEDTFALGMNYTESPVQPGASKVLVNFDMANDDTSLKPRAGIRVGKVAMLKPDTRLTGAEAWLESFCNSDISAISETSYEDNDYIITCDLTTKNLYMAWAKKSFSTYDIGIEAEGYEAGQLNRMAKIKTFNDIKIHDMEIATPIKRQIGTKAFNDSYFFFCTNRDNPSQAPKLFNTFFDELNIDGPRFGVHEVVPTALTALEASPNKYNMLLNNPYTFQNSIVAGAFVAHGILPYLNSNLVVSPKVNTKYKFSLNYSAPSNSKYDIVWEWKDYNGTNWTEVKRQTITIASTAPDITCDFASPIKSSLLRVTVTGYTGDTLNTYPDQVLAMSINCDSESQTAASNATLKNYDLSQATGMCYWQNRLVLWGFSSDPVIIASETNLPEWFPYPNNLDIFDEEIISCVPYLDYLLVFTTKKLYQLTMMTDGSGWTKTCIQDNLRLTDFDANLIRTIKNMVFFKSGNSYYMVVPSASSAGMLTIAPIAKPIQWFLDNFSVSIKDIFKNVYGYLDEFELIDCYNYVDHDDIITNYVFKTKLSKDDNDTLLNFCLIYNVDTRAWRTHMFCSYSRYKMFRQDATKSGTLMCSTSISETIEYNSGTIITAPIFQFFDKDDNVPRDLFIAPGTEINEETTLADIKESFDEYYLFKNYQYLDTGYRVLDYPNTKKRHREFQFRFNNKDEAELKFGFGFMVDGDERRSLYNYTVERNENPDSDRYQVLEVVPHLIEHIVVEPITVLGLLEAGLNAWTLNTSQFSLGPLFKARIRLLTGKGYNSKMILLSTNETNYELLGFCWVYKLMNLR